MSADLYGLFWENSKLGPVTVRNFRRQLDEYASHEHDRDELRYPLAGVRLGRPRDALAWSMEERRSERSFADRPFAERRLGSIFSAFGVAGDGSRSFPSAGASYPLEIFALLPNVAGALGGKVVYYEPREHALTPVADLPPWNECRELVNLEPTDGVPHVVVVFVLLPDRTTAKYGERGGRFALIEVGHAAQNLALRLAHDRLVGCEIGGMLDEPVRSLLRLDQTRAQIALGYACGLPRRGQFRRR
jgi:SagB-type dehydrogenase family enzyme